MTGGSQPGILLKVQDLLVRRGGATVLDIPALDLFQGQVLSLIGPNGAGKSTLMLTLAGLLKPSRGTIFFREERIADGGFAYRRHIAMVFQEPLLFDATVFENVATGLKIRGIGRSEIDRTVPLYLERFGIGHLTKRSARKLSGGEAQRTSLARAFVTKPEIIFLDEPFSALDPPTREALTGDLERILRETHTTAVASTHDQSEALRLADRLAVVHGELPDHREADDHRHDDERHDRVVEDRVREERLAFLLDVFLVALERFAIFLNLLARHGQLASSSLCSRMSPSR